MVRGPDADVPVPINAGVREEIRRLAEAGAVGVGPKEYEFIWSELRITLKEVARLIIEAADGTWKLFKGTTQYAAPHIGEPYFRFKPTVEGRRLYLKFKIIEVTSKSLMVISIHDDSMRGLD